MEITKPKINPVGDQIVIRIIEDNMTSGGLHVPSTASLADTPRGVVVAVGPGHLIETGEYMPMMCGSPAQPIVVGDILMVKGGHMFTIDGDKLMSCVLADLLGVLPKGSCADA